MRTRTLVTLTLAVAGSLASPAYADVTVPFVTTGKPVAVFADPNDVVVLLAKNGDCGEPFFAIRRTKPNFKEFTAVALTALSTGKELTLFVESCGVDKRNILSGGAVGN